MIFVHLHIFNDKFLQSLHSVGTKENAMPKCISHYSNGITAMGCKQCLHLGVVQLKGKPC